jgi:general secretion pathway protein D
MTLSASCSHVPQEINRAERLAEAGNYEAALQALREQYQKDPGNTMYKGALIRTTNLSLAALCGLADSALKEGRSKEAKELYKRALAVDPKNRRASSGIRLVEQVMRQQDLLRLATIAIDDEDYRSAMNYARKVLAENPEHKEARRIRSQLRAREQKNQHHVTFSQKMDQGISLELRDTGLKDALLLISQSAKLNFILDHDITTDTPVTLFVTDARLEDVIEFMLQTYALEKKPLNSNTLLIYPATPEKKARYADLYTRTYHISHSDPGALAEVLRSVLKPSDLHIDEASRSLVIRDTAEILEAAEQLIELHDVAPPEVLLDVEILEVSSDVLSNLGIDYPSRLSFSVKGQDGKAGALRFSELADLNGDSFTLGVGDPLAVLNLKNTLGNGNILAKPQIRVKNREQANILIGDRVPVITSTLNQTSGFESQSVTYLDVGIKLDVQPEIFPGNEVSIKVLLEVSNIAKEIVGDSGLLAYQIGTRTANTTLQLRDGETQILAGLIKNEEINSESRVPGLASIPGLGRFFINENNTHKKSELVLLITPRIVRNIQLPDAETSQFYSGTKDRFSLKVPSIG